MIIRDATEADWPAIYPFFSGIIAAGRSIAYDEGMSSDQARPYWMSAAPGRTVVATDSETVLGTANMGPNRPGRGAHIATATFMVDPAHQGKGVGRALGVEVLRWARHNGYHGMQFNAVVETNTAAVHLWKSLGFEILATVPEAFSHPDHGLVGLHLMYQRLAAADEG
jgi:L-amino acid N-acyltransferase YncA